jgi:hypothetical protein
MENYIGCKIIKAELSNLEEYKKKKYGKKHRLTKVMIKNERLYV